MSKGSKRVHFSASREIVDLPNLIEVQISSYEQFLQRNILPHERENTGLESVFRETFPITSVDGKTSLNYVSYHLGEPKYSFEKSLHRGVTYQAPLKVRFRLQDDTGIKEEDVYMGMIPLMGRRGTFVINGAERVVVSQFHRSPGISFEKSLHPKGITTYSFRIIPFWGTWLEVAFDIHDLVHVHIDRKHRRRKILATTLLRAFGYSTNEDILKEFFDFTSVKLSSSSDLGQLSGKILAKDIVIDRKVRDGAEGPSDDEPQNHQDAQDHQDVQEEKTEEAAEEGQRLVLGRASDTLTSVTIKRMIDMGVEEIFVLEGSTDSHPILKMLAKDPTTVQEEAIKELYRKFRPGEPTTLANARSAIMRFFFDEKRYQLGRVGRYKINKKLGAPTTEGDLKIGILRREDIVLALRYLFALQEGREGYATDDIDHLGNRRVRSVGELVQNQCHIGLTRMERLIRDRISMSDPSSDTLTPGKAVSARAFSSNLKEFFSRSQLSQFSDQNNAVTELTHKRRVSSLGPGGLNRDRTGFEARDVHTSHYGRVCPVETPEGPNIGLITSLASYAKVNEMGFIETPYRIVRDGIVTEEIEYLTADLEEKYVIAQASTKYDDTGFITDEVCRARHAGESMEIETSKVTHMDVSSGQIFSIVTGLIPFLEHDDANRALMGSNMQRQAVPLLLPQSPVVGTGLEERVAKDAGVLIVAGEDGVIESVDARQITLTPNENPSKKISYPLKNFIRSNAGTCVHHRPICKLGDRVKKGDVLADGPGTDQGELALGRNVLVAFMPWYGYTYEDGIVVSERLLREDAYTSIYVAEFEATARDTKLGREEITRDIPNVSEIMLNKLDEDGVIKVGTEVAPGDILVGKVVPKPETELSPEARLLRAIFGKKSSDDVKDVSLTVPMGTSGVVMDVKVFSKKDRLSKTDEDLVEEASAVKVLQREYKERTEELHLELCERLGALLLDEEAPGTIVHRRTSEIIIPEGKKVSQIMLETLEEVPLEDLVIPAVELYEEAKNILLTYRREAEQLKQTSKASIEQLKKGDGDLEMGVIKKVKVYIATKRGLQVGDKMAGRHGNKGVVAAIVPEEDMPYMEDGRTVDIILNPLGIPSRMNMGQLLETHLGYVAQGAGLKVASPIFEGFPEEEIWKMFREQGLPEDGKFFLFDGKTGERFDQRVVVGTIYMMKLNHLVADKIHSRATGPYSLVTQQPLGGKAQGGGQRCGEMEVWALEAYGVSYILLELLTVKSDDVLGRVEMYTRIVKGFNFLSSHIPESVNVLIKEIQSLGFDLRFHKVEHKDQSDTYIDVDPAQGDFDAVSIRIASDDVIVNEWSHGEVKKPETINYRTFKPEKGGISCEKIFGPVRDWECSCGKHKKIKHKNVFCNRCGVEVTLSKVRRERMGHIKLPVPVVNILLFKTPPSLIGNLLGLSKTDLEHVIYYDEYIVVDPMGSKLKHKQILTDAEYREAQLEWGRDGFSAKMGGEAIQDLLLQEDLEALVLDTREKLKKTRSVQGRVKIAKRLKVVEGFMASGNKPEWLVSHVLPVMPPDLRPLVLLDGGRFATSDVNDLIRRVLGRSNRLKMILRLKTPDVIVRNEKRMLQESVDALIDNGRHGHPVMGTGNRPLKSLSEMLRGKQGRFRENLLGKRVDYSGRSVIVCGPELNLNQCGLPKQMALDLFEPFVVKKLKDLGHVYTIRAAKKLIHGQSDIVWDILEEVIQGHPVLLNRAPTLHRLGIQAFQPVLVEGQAIRIHPLVCAAFNADFDGDQMAVHVPLSVEAQLEARLLMMASDNIFLPSSGKPVTTPSQDMLLGIYYLLHDPIGFADEELSTFSNEQEVLYLLGLNVASKRGVEKRIPGSMSEERLDSDGWGIPLHRPILVRLRDNEDGSQKESLVRTTPGRVLFNTILPRKMKYHNYSVKQKSFSSLIVECHEQAGLEETVRFLDRMKDLGFWVATKSGISLGVKDVIVPDEKADLLGDAYERIKQVREHYNEGVITNRERYDKVISIWTEVTDQLSKKMFKNLEADFMNPLYIMMNSGARGNPSQVKQLGAMRGLIVKPSDEIIEWPITASFREGMTAIEYFNSSHGARKGLVDTALKTADAGYLTRRLVDISQSITIVEEDCGTLMGVDTSRILLQGKEELLSLKDRIYGRFVCEDVLQPGDSTKYLAKAGDLITSEQAEAIDNANVEEVRIRSPLTCESEDGICAKCYGLNLAAGRVACKGEPVGIIAAQSIGEPGTQLTMRTFHMGGIASTSFQPDLLAEKDGVVVYVNIRCVRNVKGHWVVLNKNGALHIVEDHNLPVEEYVRRIQGNLLESLQVLPVEMGTEIYFENGAKVSKGAMLAHCEQSYTPVICDRPGYVAYEDLVEGVSMTKNKNPQTGKVECMVKQHGGGFHPQVLIYNDKERTDLAGTYTIPSGAILQVEENEYVCGGDLLARVLKGQVRTADITGGLLRIGELCEARKPKNAAEIARIDGTIDFKGVQKNKRVVTIHDEMTGMEEHHFVPLNKHLVVQKGDVVVRGQQLTEGTVSPHEILEVGGPRALYTYMKNQFQEVYRLQGVHIDDRHVEIIIRQMLQKVSITHPGDTTFLYGEEVFKKAFHEENQKAIESGSRPAQARSVLMPMTKGGLGAESFIRRASFQDTTRSLSNAAAFGEMDDLKSAKENVIIGRRVPLGTGFDRQEELRKTKHLRERAKHSASFEDEDLDVMPDCSGILSRLDQETSRELERERS